MTVFVFPQKNPERAARRLVEREWRVERVLLPKKHPERAQEDYQYRRGESKGYSS